jgi:hypothetical protein
MDQGPHVFWLSKGTVDARPDLVISLIHYEVRSSTYLLYDRIIII